jgi:hypothetical protein
MTSEVFLNDAWTYYFHDPNNIDWTTSSYIRLHDVSTVQDFWNMYNVLKSKLKNGMFFFMRSDCFPCWDDASNINGGCLSMKVLKENIESFWLQLAIRIAGENVLQSGQEHMWSCINGLSVSPKKYFCVVKIWLRNNELADEKYFRIPEIYNGDIFYKSNLEVIKKNNEINT